MRCTVVELSLALLIVVGSAAPAAAEPPTPIPPAYAAAPVYKAEPNSEPHGEQSASPVNPAPPGQFELAPMVGYQVGGQADVPGGSVGIADSPTYGVAFDYLVIPSGAARLGLEGAYRIQNTELDSNVAGLRPSEVFGLTNHYFEAGAQIELRGRTRPFAGFSVGGTLLAPHAPASDEFRFLTSLYGGVKFILEKGIGVRAQAKLSGIYLNSSSGLFCGFGECARTSLGTGIWQVDFSVGPVLAF